MWSIIVFLVEKENIEICFNISTEYSQHRQKHIVFVLFAKALFECLNCVSSISPIFPWTVLTRVGLQRVFKLPPPPQILNFDHHKYKISTSTNTKFPPPLIQNFHHHKYKISTTTNTNFHHHKYKFSTSTNTKFPPPQIQNSHHHKYKISTSTNTKFHHHKYKISTSTNKTNFHHHK